MVTLKARLQLKRFLRQLECPEARIRAVYTDTSGPTFRKRYIIQQAFGLTPQKAYKLSQRFEA